MQTWEPVHVVPKIPPPGGVGRCLSTAQQCRGLAVNDASQAAGKAATDAANAINQALPAPTAGGGMVVHTDPQTGEIIPSPAPGTEPVGGDVKMPEAPAVPAVPAVPKFGGN